MRKSCPLMLAIIVVLAFISMGCGWSDESKPDGATTPGQDSGGSVNISGPNQGEGTALQSSGPGGSNHLQSLGQAEIAHVHGMGFSVDGRQLIVAAHDGLHIFANDRWQTPNLPTHDYMGFIATDDGFYSSGHPDPSANMSDPFGLIKSSDGGKTLTRLGFEGESDFHLMGVGYQNHAIYVLNSEPNSKLPQPGLYYSLDDGQTWQHSAMNGLTADPIQIVVHPGEANVLVMATLTGLYLSNDYGATFEPVAQSGSASAAMFTADGNVLIFGYQGLFAYDVVNEQVLELSAPAFAPGDAIGYIAVSPIRIEDVAVTTFQKDIFLSKDGTFSWQQIAQAGIGLTLN